MVRVPELDKVDDADNELDAWPEAETVVVGDAVADTVVEHDTVCDAEAIVLRLCVDETVPDAVVELDSVLEVDAVVEGVDEGRTLALRAAERVKVAVPDTVDVSAGLALADVVVLAVELGLIVARLDACKRLGAVTPPHAHVPRSVTVCALAAIATEVSGLTGTWSLYCALLPPATAQPQHPTAPAQPPQPTQQLSAPLAAAESCSSM